MQMIFFYGCVYPHVISRDARSLLDLMDGWMDGWMDRWTDGWMDCWQATFSRRTSFCDSTSPDNWPHLQREKLEQKM